MVWPRAQLGYKALAHATRLVQEEMDQEKKVVLKVPMKRMATMDKQVGMAERLLAELLLEADHLERAALTEAATQRERAAKSLSVAEQADILQTI